MAFTNITSNAILTLPPNTDNPTSLLVWTAFVTLRAIPTLLYLAITFVTITIPSWLYTLLSISLTVTINFSTLALLILVSLSTASYLFRYRYHKYGKALPEPISKDTRVEVPAPQAEPKPGLSNYLDEFMSAIKVFGFLDKAVFHELTRTMHTRRLSANETFLLEEEKGFCLVVEGTVQIFAKSNTDDDHAASDSESDGEDRDLNGQYHGYQLLTEVKNGSPMSSLFNILSLFTEDIATTEAEILRNDQSNGSYHSRTNSLVLTRPSFTRDLKGRSSSSSLSLNPTFSRSQPPTRLGSPNMPAAHKTRVPSFNLDNTLSPSLKSSPSFDLQSSDSLKYEPRKVPIIPQIVARAAEDSTIAIIPASAFKRLTKLYPKSTAQVVQVILTRFYRVTLATAYGYLGLKQEVLQTEKEMNKTVNVPIPEILLDSHLEHLKQEFARERERLTLDEVSKGIALRNPSVSKHRKPISFMRKAVESRAKMNAELANGKQNINLPSPENYRTGISAGDLLRSNRNSPLITPAHKLSSLMEDSYFHPTTLYLRQQDVLDESLQMREAVFNCICSALGLNPSSDTPASIAETAEPATPRLVLYDSKKNRAVFNSVFGLMAANGNPIHGGGDGESESNVSQVTATVQNAGLTSKNTLAEVISEIEIVFFPKDTIIASAQERPSGLYFVIDGFLEVGSSNDNFFLVKPGSFAGYLPSLGGFRSFFDIKARSDVILGVLPRDSVNKLEERYPIILLTFSKRLTSLLDRLILHIDFALEYLQINAGQTIYEQNETSDSIYIILNGRLRAIQDNDQGKSPQVIGEYGQGDSVGELEILTESVRPGSLYAIRDSEVARLPMTLFNNLAQEKPAITLKMSKILAQKMRNLIYQPTLDSARERAAIGGALNSSAVVNLRTVGILPVRDGVPVSDFASNLESALIQVGASVITLQQSAVREHLGRHAFSKVGKLKLSQYLADLEEKFDIVLYVCDSTVQSAWTTTCILQSDCILVVGVAESSSSIGEYERVLLTANTTARKELVLLHSERYCPAGLTRKWLSERIWINGGHHHIQLVGLPSQSNQRVNRSVNLSELIKQRMRSVQAEIRKYTGRGRHQAPLYSPVAPFKNDFHRLARRLCGKSIGLVLGGGGARGIAHVGIIRAMEEAGIPIDMVGGTSIGAFVGALYAWDNAGIVTMYGRIKRFAGKMASMWRFALDLTYPSTSYTSGLEFNRGIWTTFGNYLIEDFWLPFYCNTTNISRSCAEYHNSGYVWRYVRASMSLAGLVPPLCEDGSMLLDGGYIDNLTVAHMKGLGGVSTIFAIDVGSLDDNMPQTYGDHLSGFWTIWNRINPFGGAVNPPPNLGDIQSRLAYVSSVEALERAKNTPGCHYMRPPIDGYGTLAFREFETIYKIGYEYGTKFVAELKEKKLLPILEEAEEDKSDLKRTRMIRRASI